MTRKLITSLFHSLDGVASAPNLFQFDSFDDDLGQWMTGAINSVDDCVLGRTSYEEWAGYWPNITSGEDTSQLLDAELIDELTLAIHPVVAGSGRGVFDGEAPKRLSPTDVQRTSKGNLLVTYTPRPA